MSHSTRKTRVLLADDHSLVAAGLRSMLEAEYDIVGTAENGRDVVKLAAECNPDVILLDISMPELNGIEAARQLRKLVPHAKLIFVTMHMDATFVREAMAAGGSGYVAKRSAPTELKNAIEQVLRGRKYLTPLVTRELLDCAFTPAETPNTYGQLTSRQREVLQLIAEGHGNKEIAARLNVSAKTVEFHKTNIARTLGLSSTAAMVKYAVRHGLVSL